jgi:hypothetical protein
VRLDDLPDDARAELEQRARAEGIPPEAYALRLVLGGLSAQPAAPPTPARSWKEWRAEVARREPVEGVDAAAAVAEARSERDAELDAALGELR